MIETVIIICVMAPFVVLSFAGSAKALVTLLGNGKELQDS